MAQLNLQALLKAMLDKGASDLHITAGSPPRLRIDNELVRLQTEPLTPVDTKQLCYSVMNDAQKLRFEEDLEIDFSFGIRNLARFRANVYMQQTLRGGRVPHRPVQDHPARGSRPAAGGHGAVRQAARPRARHRPDGLGQVDDARVDDRPHQHADARSHRHHRGSDRVPAHATRRAWSTSARSVATASRSSARSSTSCARIPTSC